ncbi:MAG: TonB-dependent receptor, partial [Bacteroidota bacterium]
GSGLPFTPAFQNQRTGLLNSENRPRSITIDLYASKSFSLISYRINLFTKIFNVFDARNERDVFSDTGRANYSLEANFTGSPRGVNTIEEFFRRPDFFSAPRQVVVGLDFSF